MITVEEIESAIENLKIDEFQRLAKWVEAKVADTWDRRIGQNSLDGKLDFLFDEAKAERGAGELNPWPATR